jgi:hypothetical protein
VDVEITPEPSEEERQAILVALSHEEDEDPPLTRSRWGCLDLEEDEGEG